MSLREDVAQIASLLGIHVTTLPQAIEEANLMMGIAGGGDLPTQAHVLLEACNSTTEAVVASAGRDFSGRGDWSAHATTNADDDLEMLPNMQVASSFLEKNSQAHTSAMTALGDIVDNARESGATKLSIDVVDGPDSSTSVAPTSRRGAASNRVLKVSDNGAGMGEGRVLEGMMSIGFTRKDFSTGAAVCVEGSSSIPSPPLLLPPHLTAPHRISLHFIAPHLIAPRLTAPHPASPHRIQPNRTSGLHPPPALRQRVTRAVSLPACGRKVAATHRRLGCLACREALRLWSQDGHPARG